MQKTFLNGQVIFQCKNVHFPSIKDMRKKHLKVTYKEEDFKIGLTDLLFLYFYIMN